MSDRTGLAEALFRLDGFRVLEVTESTDELIIRIATRGRTRRVRALRRAGALTRADAR